MGVPGQLRGLIWKLLAECDEDEKLSNIKYEDLVLSDKTSQFTDVISRDLHRTMPDHVLFQENALGYIHSLLPKYHIMMTLIMK